VANTSQLNYAILVLMIAQAGVAWNILGGYAGQVSLGHAAFYGIGAYTSTQLLLVFGLSPWLGMLAGGGVAVLFALAIGWPCFRLKGHYFAMATIAIAEILQIVVTNWDWLGGAVGLSLPLAEAGWSGFVFNKSKVPYYYIVLALLLLTIGASWLIERSFLGYYFRAIKDEPDAARSIGIDLKRYKLIAIAASSFLTALGGTFYAQKELFIDPGSPWQNGWIESFNARLRDEFLNGQQFDSLFEAKVLLSDWRHEYNHERTHSALRRQTPARFAETWKFRNQQRLAELVA